MRPLSKSPCLPPSKQKALGAPAFLKKKAGKGTCFMLTTALERDLGGAYAFQNNKMHILYEFLAKEAGVKKEVDCNDPEMEMELLDGGSVMLVNHSGRSKRVLLKGTKEKSIKLQPCCVALTAKGGNSCQ